MRSAGQTYWEISEETFNDAKLIVISQDCDICASLKSEPRVEAIIVRSTEEPSEISMARKGNSARLFLLREGTGQALVADARRRVSLDKKSLVDSSFESLITEERTRLRFANWLAGRYNRPAIDDALVNAVQKPLVKAVSEVVKKKAVPHDILGRISEIRFAAANPTPPLTVSFIMMFEQGEELTVEEEAEIAGWLEAVLVRADGQVETISPVFRTAQTISLHDYQNSTRLQLDHFSPEDDFAMK